MEETRGILHAHMGKQKFCLTRYTPTQDLRFFVEGYWVVRWDLREQEPHVQEVLPYPCVHLVFEAGRVRVYGVEVGKFTRLLEGNEQAFGVKFRPGGFYPFVHIPMTRLTSTSVTLRELFGEDACKVEQELGRSHDDITMKAVLEAFLRERLPERDEHVEEVNRVVRYIVEHPEATRVEDLVRALGLNKRRVQQLFQHYVGVPPKWIISRYRLHEAAQRLAQGREIDWTNLALDLGYFDQAHFIKDFKALVGSTPGEYARAVRK